MRANGLEPSALPVVQKRPESAPWLFLIEGRIGGKPGLSIEAPLFIEDGCGDYSDEMKTIYHIMKEDGADGKLFLVGTPIGNLGDFRHGRSRFCKVSILLRRRTPVSR